MRLYTDLSFLLFFGSDLVGIDTMKIGVGRESIESDPEPEPDSEATLLSLSPFSSCCLEGLDDFSRSFPPYTVTSIHCTYPDYALFDDVDIDDVDNKDDDNVDIRALVIQDMKRL